MYYVYCEETGDELMLEKKDEAIKAAQEMIRTQMLDEAADSGEVHIFEPTMVVYGSVDVNFKLEPFKEEEKNDKDLSVTESSTTEN